MSNRIEVYKKIVEIESLLENISLELNVLDKKEDSQVLSKQDSINLKFLENRRESLINELHQLEIELVENTWREKSTTFQSIENINKKQSKYS